MTESKLTPVPKRGRPRPSEPHVSAHAWIPKSSYDRIAQLALKHDVSMSSVLRDLVSLRLAQPFPNKK